MVTACWHTACLQAFVLLLILHCSSLLQHQPPWCSSSMAIHAFAMCTPCSVRGTLPDHDAGAANRINSQGGGQIWAHTGTLQCPTCVNAGQHWRLSPNRCMCRSEILPGVSQWQTAGGAVVACGTAVIDLQIPTSNCAAGKLLGWRALASFHF